MSFKKQSVYEIIAVGLNSQRQRMTPRSEIVSMFSVVWKQFVQNVTRIVQYVRKKVVVHVSSELRQHRIVSCIQAISCRHTWKITSTGSTFHNGLTVRLVGWLVFNGTFCTNRLYCAGQIQGQGFGQVNFQQFSFRQVFDRFRFFVIITTPTYLLCCSITFCSCGSNGRHAVTVEANTRRYHVVMESVADILLADCGTPLYTNHINH